MRVEIYPHCYNLITNHLQNQTIMQVYCSYHTLHGECLDQDYLDAKSGRNPSRMVRVKFEKFTQAVPFNTLFEVKLSSFPIENALNKLRAPFLIKFDHLCNVFKILGNGSSESPRWIQYRADKSDENSLYFQSSRNSNIYFTLNINQLSDEERQILMMRFESVYEYFRSLKYRFLKENHPTITI